MRVYHCPVGERSLRRLCHLRRWGSTAAVAAADTIFALATPSGRSAIAIVRVSGPSAAAILTALAPGRVGALPSPRRLVARRVTDPTDGSRIDTDAMCVWMPGPDSSTGEDCAELHVHGGRAVSAALLRALGRLARPAAPGEFTRRAFARGKLDALQVEALADLLNADTDAQRRAALAGLDGVTSARYNAWRAQLITALAHVEAVLDFSEEQDDVGEGVFGAVGVSVAAVAAAVRAHVAEDGGRGELLRRGVSVVLTGAVNAGKSSVLNALARRPAAIVSPTPGTTRDVIEVAMDLGGVPAVVVDTAGLREGTEVDAVEAEGIRRARTLAAAADVLVRVIDARQPWSDALLAGLPPSAIVVLNKCDAEGEGGHHALLPPATLEAELRSGGGSNSGVRLVRVSCVTGAGIAELTTLLEAAATAKLWGRGGGGGGGSSSGVPEELLLVSRERHRHHLLLCCEALERFGARPQIDMAAEELRLAVRELGAIVGVVGVEDVLDELFASFCIGK